MHPHQPFPQGTPDRAIGDEETHSHDDAPGVPQHPRRARRLVLPHHGLGQHFQPHHKGRGGPHSARLSGIDCARCRARSTGQRRPRTACRAFLWEVWVKRNIRHRCPALPTITVRRRHPKMKAWLSQAAVCRGVTSERCIAPAGCQSCQEPYHKLVVRWSDRAQATRNAHHGFLKSPFGGVSPFQRTPHYPRLQASASPGKRRQRRDSFQIRT